MKKISLKGRSFLTLKDFTKEEIKYLLALSSYLKTKKKIGIVGNLLDVLLKWQQQMKELIQLL